MADNENFQAAAFTGRGTAREQVTLPEATFDGTVNMPVMHQAVKAFLANQRQANAHTKIRKYVTGGNQKPWKQKGTGRARQGSTRAPNWVGGGTVFGPTNERNYKQAVPRQVRQLARKSALNARARENSIIVIDAFNYDAPKTSRMQALVASVGAADRKVLILTDGVKPNVFLSARNLPTVHVMPFADASTYHILWSDTVLIESSALGQPLEPIAGEAEAPSAPGRTKAKAAKTPAAKAEGNRATVRAGEKAEKKTAKQSAKKEKAKSVKAAAKKATAKKATAKKAVKKSASAKSPAKKASAKKAPAKKAAAKKPAAKKSTKKGR